MLLRACCSNGGIVSVDNLISTSTGQPQAIVEAFYPSTRGGEALYSQLSGLTNRWGRLPVTIYAQDYTRSVGLDDFNMTGHPGRTYRYFKGKPVSSQHARTSVYMVLILLVHVVDRSANDSDAHPNFAVV